MFNFDDIREILDNAPKKVLSLLLKVDPADQANQSDTPAWKIYAKNSLRELEASVTEKQLPDWKELRQQAEDYLENYQVQGKTLVMYIGKNDFFKVFHLPMALENQSSYGAALILPLLWALDEYEEAMVVLIDKEKAEFLKVYMNDANINERMRIHLEQFEQGDNVYTFKPSGARSGTGFTHSNQKDDFAALVEEQTQQFYREVLAEMEKRLKNGKIKRLILGGNHESAKALESLLSDKLSAIYMGVLPIPFISSEKQIAEAIEQHASMSERSDELDLVNSVIDLAKSGGRGALGKAEIEQAIKFRQIELLILPYPPRNEDLALRWIREVFNMSGSVEFVDGPAAERLEEEGGVAARLYYQIAEQNP
jgi:hypothetical protein